jgi:hypothetical protein
MKYLKVINHSSDILNNESLKSSGASINPLESDSDFTQLFFQLCEVGNYKMAKYLYKNFSNRINCRLYSVKSELTKALANNQMEIAHLLMSLSMVNSKDYYLTLVSDILVDIVNEDNVSKLKFIINNAIKNLSDFNYQLFINELLYISCIKEKYKIAHFAIACNADIYYDDDRLLRYVCYASKIDVMHFLLDNGWDVSINGEKLLRYSCVFDKFITAEYLLINGVKGILTLCQLLNEGNIENAEFLIKSGVDKESALILACKENYLSACSYLIEVVKNIHANDERALTIAVVGGNLAIIKLLVRHDARVNHQVLIAASTSPDDRVDIVRYLINQGSSLAIDFDTYSHLAFTVGNYQISKFLKKFFQKRLIH